MENFRAIIGLINSIVSQLQPILNWFDIQYRLSDTTVEEIESFVANIQLIGRLDDWVFVLQLGVIGLIEYISQSIC